MNVGEFLNDFMEELVGHFCVGALGLVNIDRAKGADSVTTVYRFNFNFPKQFILLHYSLRKTLIASKTARITKRFKDVAIDGNVYSAIYIYPLVEQSVFFLFFKKR